MITVHGNIRLVAKKKRPASHLIDARAVDRFAILDDGIFRCGRLLTPFLHGKEFHLRRWQVISKEQHQVNEAIRAREVRLIGADNDQLGIKPVREALRMAQEADLDLVNVAPQAKPPVCRIMDYGKYRYEQSKREKEARKKQKTIQVKEIRFSPSIEEHDINTKLRNVKKFLNNGDKVKLTIRFRGREITHQDLGRKILQRMATEVKDIGDVERQPKLEGRHMIMILSPKQP